MKDFIEELKRPRDPRPPAVLLIDPKYPHNVGGALRACSCWGMNQLWFSGNRVLSGLEDLSRLPREERMKGYKEVDLVHSDRHWKAFENADVVPVAVEVRPGSENLVHFEHPENALYVFGPEDGSLNGSVLRWCHRFLFIPTAHCLNLAAAVNVVLYDRRLKEVRDGKETRYGLGEYLREQRGPLFSDS